MTTSTSATPAACPNPDGGLCAGPLEAGKHQTSLFSPAFNVTVPAGWANYEDIQGAYLFIPPGGDFAGVDPGSSDYVEVETDVAPPKGCQPGAAPGIPRTSAGMAGWVVHNPAFASPKPRKVTVGGLSGIVVDLRLAKGWKHACFYSNGVPVGPLLFGLGTSTGVEHNVFGPDSVTRLYILDYRHRALAIELVDINDAGHLDSFSKVVRTITFSA